MLRRLGGISCRCRQILLWDAEKLDAFHLIQRVSKEINCEHPCKGRLLKYLSECIFTDVEEDVVALEAARQRGGIKNHRMQYVRAKIEAQRELFPRSLLLLRPRLRWTGKPRNSQSRRVINVKTSTLPIGPILSSRRKF